MNDPAGPEGFHLLDLSAIVVGYGMASLLVRAFWPSGEWPPLGEIAVIGLFYSWLGLAMSGPLVLLVHRPPGPSSEGGVFPGRSTGSPAGTRVPSPSPLAGEGRGGGYPGPTNSRGPRPSRRAPHPGPPPQGGREEEKTLASEPGPSGGPAVEETKEGAATPAAVRRTWAETAWLIVGFYWMFVTFLVVPGRLHRSPLHDGAVLGLFPIAAALVLRLLDRGSRRRWAVRDVPAWTHRAAVGLLLTWPLAWLALILLGKSLL